MHAALLGAPAVDRIDRLAGLELRHHLALAGDDPDEDVGAHRRGEHRADQQEGGAAGEQLAGQPRGEDDEDEQRQRRRSGHRASSGRRARQITS